MLFKILSESGVAAGVRRIEALTGEGVMEYYRDLEQKLFQAAALLKTAPAELSDKITHLQAELKAAHSENESLKSKLAQNSLCLLYTSPDPPLSGGTLFRFQISG